jgi:non-canonical (house-cleaning) NTP pyrophosphatase
MFKSWRIAKVATIAIVAVAVLSSGAASASTPGHHHHRVVPTGAFGTVASVSGTSAAGTCGVADAAGTFTLTSAHGATDTVNVSTTTTFEEHGVTTPTFANVCVGDKVGAFGMISSGTVTATGVFVTLPVVFGTVASVNGTATAGTCGTADTAGTFTLDAAHSTTDTVNVSTTTTFEEHGVTMPTFATVCVGNKVGAFGIVSSGTVTATAVFVTSPKPPVVFGTVASVNGTATAGTCGTADTAGTFTLDAAHSTTDTVDVGTTTTFEEHGVTTPTFATVCVGDKAGAVGALTSGTVTATSVFVTPMMMTPKPHTGFGTPKGSTPGPKVDFGAHSTSGPFTNGSNSGHGSDNHLGFGSGGSTNRFHSNDHSSGHNSH